MEFMLDQVPHMILQWDEEGNMTYSNSLWREFTGMHIYLNLFLFILFIYCELFYFLKIICLHNSLVFIAHFVVV